MDKALFVWRKSAIGEDDRFKAAVPHHGDEDGVRHEEIFRQMLQLLFQRRGFRAEGPVFHRIRMMETQTGKDVPAVLHHLDETGLPAGFGIQDDGFREALQMGGLSPAVVDGDSLLDAEHGGAEDAAVSAEAVLQTLQFQKFRSKSRNIQPEDLTGPRPGHRLSDISGALLQEILADPFQ